MGIGATLIPSVLYSFSFFFRGGGGGLFFFGFFTTKSFSIFFVGGGGGGGHYFHDLLATKVFDIIFEGSLLLEVYSGLVGLFYDTGKRKIHCL